MAIGIYFAVQGMSAEKYDDVIKQLQDAGQGAPAGRTYHVAFEGENGLQVFDVWDSQEAFDAFGETLMPIRRGRHRPGRADDLPGPQHHHRLTPRRPPSTPRAARPCTS